MRTSQPRLSAEAGKIPRPCECPTTKRGATPINQRRTTMLTAASSLTVKADDPASRDLQLEQAASLLRGVAIRCGILVTRVDYLTFTVAFSPDIPYGLTQERDLVKEGQHAFAKNSPKSSRKRLTSSNRRNGPLAPAQDGDPYLNEEQEHEIAETQPLLIWKSLTRGDVVSLRTAGNRDQIGTVEASTSDGLIIWIRDDLNERRLFHFHDCQSVRLLVSRSQPRTQVSEGLGPPLCGPAHRPRA